MKKKISHQMTTGFSFGSTSAIITTLGLMIGLDSSTGSRMAVMAGILTIAIADAFSDALGIHVSEESENKHSHKEIWASTAYTFIAKFVVGMSFVIAVALLPLKTAMTVNIVYGLLFLSVSSYFVARAQKQKPLPVIAEHVLVAGIVIIIAHFVGDIIHYAFNV